MAWRTTIDASFHVYTEYGLRMRRLRTRAIPRRLLPARCNARRRTQALGPSQHADSARHIRPSVQNHTDEDRRRCLRAFELFVSLEMVYSPQEGRNLASHRPQPRTAQRRHDTTF